MTSLCYLKSLVWFSITKSCSSMYPSLIKHFFRLVLYMRIIYYYKTTQHKIKTVKNKSGGQQMGVFLYSFFSFTDVLKDLLQHCQCIHGELLQVSLLFCVCLSHHFHESCVLLMRSLKERQQRRLVNSWCRAFAVLSAIILCRFFQLVDFIFLNFDKEWPNGLWVTEKMWNPLFIEEKVYFFDTNDKNVTKIAKKYLKHSFLSWF